MTKTFIIAEAGVNHNGSLEMAKQLIDVAVEAGADAVKFQTFNTTSSISKNAPKAEYQNITTDKNETQLEMVRKLELSQQDFITLNKYAHEKNIVFLSTPFDKESVHFLTDVLEVPLIKIASGEIVNLPLILEIAKKQKPIILSTGMSFLYEIEQALAVIAFGYLDIKERPTMAKFKKAYISEEGQNLLKKNVTLLHCTTEYPTPFEDVNLNVIDSLKTSFNLNVGLSDHTIGIEVPVAAVAKGATMVEKHITLNKNLEGPDHRASLEPFEFASLVKSIRNVEKALGSSIKKPAISELKNIETARKSLVANVPIKKGEKFTENNLAIKRPGKGISPMHFWEMIGQEAKRNFQEDELIE